MPDSSSHLSTRLADFRQISSDDDDEVNKEGTEAAAATGVKFKAVAEVIGQDIGFVRTIRSSS